MGNFRPEFPTGTAKANKACMAAQLYPLPNPASFLSLSQVSTSRASLLDMRTLNPLSRCAP